MQPDVLMRFRTWIQAFQEFFFPQHTVIALRRGKIIGLADLYYAFADPDSDPADISNADPCGSGSETLISG
jgi:hypothetical protein